MKLDILLPRGHQIWGALGGESRLVDHPHLEDLLTKLHASNAKQWAEEDRARDARAAKDVASAKADIDRLNIERVALVHAINEYFFRALAPDPHALPLTEGPGSVCDRLSVLRLRLEHAQERLANEPDQVNGLALEGAVLQVAFDVMLSDIQLKRRRFDVFPTRKLYGNRK